MLPGYDPESYAVLTTIYDDYYQTLLKCFDAAIAAASVDWPQLVEPAFVGVRAINDEKSLYYQVNRRLYISSYGNLSVYDPNTRTFVDIGVSEPTTINPMESDYSTFDGSRRLCYGPTAELIFRVFCPALLDTRAIELTKISQYINDRFKRLGLTPYQHLTDEEIRGTAEMDISNAADEYDCYLRESFINLAMLGDKKCNSITLV